MSRVTAQSARGEDLTVSLVTVSPGSKPLSWFGHSGVLVERRQSTGPLFFDYGVLSPGLETVRGVVTGRVRVHTTASDWQKSRARWVEAGRAVYVQELALTPDQRARVFDRLVDDERPERRHYLYDYRNDNCSTRIRDILDNALDGALRRSGRHSDSSTIRGVAYASMPNRWIAAFDVLFNADSDDTLSTWDAAMFPDRLSALVARTVVHDSVGRSRHLTEDIAAIARVPRPPPRSRAVFLTIGLSAAVITIALAAMDRRAVRGSRIALGAWIAVTCGLLGLVGTVLVVAWLFSAHSFVPHNQNLWIINPLLLVAAWLGIAYARGSATSRRALVWLLVSVLTLAFIGAIVRLIADGAQDNVRTLFLVLPLELALIAAVQVLQPTPQRSRKLSRVIST